MPSFCREYLPASNAACSVWEGWISSLLPIQPLPLERPPSLQTHPLHSALCALARANLRTYSPAKAPSTQRKGTLSFRPTGEILIRSLVFARDDSPRPSLGGPFDEVYPARGQRARDMLLRLCGREIFLPPLRFGRYGDFFFVARHAADDQREDHIHRNHNPAEGQHRHRDLRAGGLGVQQGAELGLRPHP